MIDYIKQHFRPYESAFIDFVEDLLRKVKDEYQPALTNFLNPRQCYILETLVNSSDEVEVDFFGGYGEAENKRGFLFPSYYECTINDFEIKILQIRYPVKFVELHHSDILGALLNTGLQRNRIGDIITDEKNNWQIIVTKQVANFIQQSSDLERIGRIKVHYSEIGIENLLQYPVQSYLVKDILVTSLRLDIIVANGYNISRSKTKELIEHGLVKINWTVIDRSNEIIAINDLISVRHYGRLKISTIKKKIKKDKWLISLNIIQK